MLFICTHVYMCNYFTMINFWSCNDMYTRYYSTVGHFEWFSFYGKVISTMFIQFSWICAIMSLCTLSDTNMLYLLVLLQVINNIFLITGLVYTYRLYHEVEAM